MMPVKIPHLLTVLFSFLIFNTVSAQTDSFTCKKYTIVSTQNVCGCIDNRWAPYAMAIGTPQSSCTRNLFKAQNLSFQQNSNGTASINGTLRNNTTWQLVVLNITLSDGTFTAPERSPKKEFCNTNANDSIAKHWAYYPKAKGTIQFGSNPPLSIQLSNQAFQVGKGANGQAPKLMGGSGAFTLNDSTTLYLDFNLNNEIACNDANGIVDNNISCDSIQFKNIPNGISISRVNAPNSDVQIFDKNWKRIYSCNGQNCTSNTINNLQSGDYIAKVKLYSDDPWNIICEKDYAIKVTGDSIPSDPCSQDRVAPSITCPTSINVTLDNSSDSCKQVTWTPPTATDNCTATPSLSSNFKPNDCFKMGNYTVIYTATDSMNNKSTCSFTITVNGTTPCEKDTLAPVITCPNNINITITSNSTCMPVKWSEPLVTDNCSTPTLTSTLHSDTCLAKGVYDIVYTAKDTSGNKATCKFTVTVTANSNICTNDTIPPTITCPSNLVITPINAADTCVKVNWTEPIATDNCTVLLSVSSDYKPNDCFGFGIKTVTYTAKDSSGNKTTCQFTITVVNGDTCQLYDTQASILNCGCSDAAKLFTPYFIYFGDKVSCSTIPSNAFDIRFKKNTDGTASLTGTGKDSIGNIIVLDIQLAGLKKTGTPRLELCNENTSINTSTWSYYTELKGTIQFGISGSPMAVSLEGSACQIGIGADGQNPTALGLNTLIKLADGRTGGLSLTLSNRQSCSAITSRLNAANTVLSLLAQGEYKRTRLEWVNNTGLKNDFFSVQKLNSKGVFENIQILNAQNKSQGLEYFTAYDNTPNEGDNYYRIKVDYTDGTERYSEVRKVYFKGVSEGIVFPNPASDFVELGLPQFKGSDVNIYLYNAYGQPVLFHTQDKIESTVKLNLSDLPTGNYLIRITAQGKRDMMKSLIITK